MPSLHPDLSGGPRPPGEVLDNITKSPKLPQRMRPSSPERLCTSSDPTPRSLTGIPEYSTPLLRKWVAASVLAGADRFELGNGLAEIRASFTYGDAVGVAFLSRWTRLLEAYRKSSHGEPPRALRVRLTTDAKWPLAAEGDQVEELTEEQRA